MDEKFESGLRAISGIKNALDEISYPICVASSGPIEKIMRSLQLTDLAEMFGENIFSSYTIQSWKPEPEIFLHAARAMKTDPHYCIVIEDALLGIRAAKSAGMRALVYAPTSEKLLLLEAGPVVVFDDMALLPQLVTDAFER